MAKPRNLTWGPYGRAQAHTYTVAELRASLARMESISEPTATERAQISAMRAELIERGL